LDEEDPVYKKMEAQGQKLVQSFIENHNIRMEKVQVTQRDDSGRQIHTGLETNVLSSGTFGASKTQSATDTHHSTRTSNLTRSATEDDPDERTTDPRRFHRFDMPTSSRRGDKEESTSSDSSHSRRGSREETQTEEQKLNRQFRKAKQKRKLARLVQTAMNEFVPKLTQDMSQLRTDVQQGFDLQDDTNYTEDFLDSPQLGTQNLTPRIKKEFASSFASSTSKTARVGLKTLLAGAKAMIQQERLDSDAAYELIRPYLESSALRSMEAYVNTDTSFEHFFVQIQHKSMDFKAPKQVEQELKKLREQPPTNISDTLDRMYELHSQRYATMTRAKRRAHTATTARLDAESYIRAYYPHLIDQVLFQERRVKEDSSKIPLPGQAPVAYHEYFTFANIACKRLSDKAPVTLPGAEPRSVHELTTEVASMSTPSEESERVNAAHIKTQQFMMEQFKALELSVAAISKANTPAKQAMVAKRGKREHPV
jgi:hypothetical protein